MSLTLAELAQFEDGGYVVKAGVYTAEDLEPIRRAIAETIDVARRGRAPHDQPDAACLLRQPH